ncbi:hypothetical protein C0063_04950 [Pseudoxanthomonas sp. KAs_5_3]|nr:hypothetical protein C0063_04950 [Pseudoxanthomonas sp. KAs_5_3]
MHAVRSEQQASNAGGTRIERITVAGIARAVQGRDLVCAGVHPHLPIVRAGGADCIPDLDVVEDAAASFSNPVTQARRTIGIEGLATQVEMVRRDLRQGATQRVSCNGDFRDVAPFTADIPGSFNRTPRQRDGVLHLRIDAVKHHRAIGNQAIFDPALPLLFALGTTVSNDDLAGVYALVDGALVAVDRAAGVFEYFVGYSTENNILLFTFWLWFWRIELVRVICQISILLAS